jgi:dolichol-phosphate mannosyltransferase
MKLLSIIFSFKNEENNLEELINRVNNACSQLDKWSYEMLFVDDCSDDGSLEKLRTLKKKFPIKIIRLSRTFGHAAGIFAGLEFCKGDAAIYLDADLQDPPELICDLVKKYEEGYDVVNTKRTKRLGESFVNLLFYKIGYFLINKLSYLKFQDNVGNYKIFSRKIINHLLNSEENEIYFRGMFVWMGYKQFTINYIRQPRLNGSSSFPVLSSKYPYFIFFNAITSFSNFLLYFIFIIGALSLLLLFAFSIIFMKNNIFNEFISELKISVYLLLFISGLQFFSIGIISLYIAKIINQINKRKRYLIDFIE